MLLSPRSRIVLFLVLIFAVNVLGAVAAAPSGISEGELIFSKCPMECDTEEPCRQCSSQGGQCKIMIRTSCSECGIVECVGAGKEKEDGGSKISTGAAVGAALGGLAAAALFGFFGFRICTRKQRARASMAAGAAEKENDFGMMRSARASTHTVASIASTVRTRASNIIQIAYIPGVTNRSQPGTPSHLVPPVPPIPFADSPRGSNYPRSGDIQFGAEDLLRDSMVTAGGADNRSSIATTIYGGNAVVSQPNVVRAGKAAVVEVKTVGNSVANSGQSSPSVPPIPALFTTGGAPNRIGAGPPSPTFSIGSTFFNRVNGRRESDSTLDTPANKNKWRDTMDTEDSSYSPCAHRPNVRASNCSSCITDMDTGSPFSDKNSVIESLPAGMGLPPPGNSRSLSMNLSGQRTLSAVGEPAIDRTASPFSDAHSIEPIEPQQRR